MEGALQGNGLSLAQVFRETGFSKAVEVGHYFVPRPAILFESTWHRNFVCRESSELREDFEAEPTGLIGAPHLHQFMTFKLLHGTVDLALKYWLVPWQVMDRNLGSSEADALTGTLRNSRRSVRSLGLQMQVFMQTKFQAPSNPCTSPFISSCNRKDEKYIPMRDRVSQHIPSADCVLAKFKPISKRKVILPRHSGKNR